MLFLKALLNKVKAQTATAYLGLIHDSQLKWKILDILFICLNKLSSAWCYYTGFFVDIRSLLSCIFVLFCLYPHNFQLQADQGL